MRCPVCEHDETKILDDGSEQNSYIRVWQCEVCESTWLESGMSVDWSFIPEWEGVGYEIEYGYRALEIAAENERQKVYQNMMRIAQANTIPLWGNS